MKHIMMKLFILTAVIIISNESTSQILFAESFPVIFDSTRSFKGAISPELNIQTQKELLLEIYNVTDVAIKIGNNSLIIANKFELEKYGSETILSGGYIYAKFKTHTDKKYMLEYYSQYHWAEERGLDMKYALGVNFRFKFYKNEKGGLFAGIGPFYEYERWLFDAVDEDILPIDTAPVEKKLLKINYYASFKRTFKEVFKIDAGFYYQSKFRSIFNNPRLASSTELSYLINEYVSIGLVYHNIYDYRTIVPIDNWYHRVFYQLSATF
ncbi:DUF481 domain-containing protein [candidate division KSB1 bacterium]